MKRYEKIQAPNPVGLRHPPQFIQPFPLGSGRNTSVAIVSDKGMPGAHPGLLSKSTGEGALLVASLRC